MTSPSTFSPKAAHAHLNQSFSSQFTYSIPFRITQLRAIRTFLQQNELAHMQALYSDLGKHRMDVLLYDVHLVTLDIALYLKKLRKMSKPIYLPRKFGAQTYIQNVPKGIVLIFGPFNFPTQLVLRPLVAAIAAGNVCCIKPSELSPSAEKFLLQLTNYVDPRVICFVSGGKEIAEQLLELQWDHIMFTGSPVVGKIVMKAASKFLTPVTLELGGKSPAIVTRSAHIPTAVSSILRARFSNCGQFCLAVDYCLVNEHIYEEFVKQLVETLKTFYTEDPSTCPHYGRLISSRHCERIKGLISNTKGDILAGGLPTSSQSMRDELFVPPTLVSLLASSTDVLMSEEIFGPILPVIPVTTTTDAIRYVNNGEKPLALYAFSQEKLETNAILQSTRSGSVAVNETVVQIAVPGSLLGGVGESGMGAYGFKRGFEEFSHQRAILRSNPFWARLLGPTNPHVMGREAWWLEAGIRIIGKIPKRSKGEEELNKKRD